MSQAFKLKTTPEEVAFLTFDEDHASMNTFSMVTLLQLRTYLKELKNDKAIKGLVLISGKPNSFIAGANIHELHKITDKKQLIEMITLGQTIFNELASFPYPTLAAIHGVCLGGGLELALACRYRLATLDPATKLGLPETQLGLIPAWGGSKRLPTLVSFQDAVKLILTGKPVSTEKAYKMGLVDAICSKPLLRQCASQFILRTPKSRVRSKTSRLVKQLIVYQAKKGVIKRVKKNYPAPLMALKLLSKGATDQTECEALLTLLQGEVAPNLINLFLNQEKAKKSHRLDTPAPSIQHPAIIGAGVMGGGLAWLLSKYEYATTLKDIDWDFITKAYREFVKFSKRVTPDRVNVNLHRISSTLSYEGIRQADLIIEAVVEDLAIKKEVFKEIETIVSPQAILCTNTSSLSLADLSENLKYPERFIGLHFFNPVSHMPLVEVVSGEKSSPQALTSAIEFVKTLKKTPIVVNDCPGFLVNRILMSGMLKALSLLEEGVDQQKIDKALEAFGLPMGPCVLADEVGLDVALKVAVNLNIAYGDRVCIPSILPKMVSQGWFGKKTKRGFYVERGKVNPQVASLLDGRKLRMKSKEIVECVISTMYHEAMRCLDENICNSPEEIDLALILGTGFPPFRGGLMHYKKGIV